MDKNNSSNFFNYVCVWNSQPFDDEKGNFHKEINLMHTRKGPIKIVVYFVLSFVLLHWVWFSEKPINFNNLYYPTISYTELYIICLFNSNQLCTLQKKSGKRCCEFVFITSSVPRLSLILSTPGSRHFFVSSIYSLPFGAPYVYHPTIFSACIFGFAWPC